jgi:hypothetical protein
MIFASALPNRNNVTQVLRQQLLDYGSLCR